MAKEKDKDKAKKKKNIKLPVGVLHIHTSFNNTIVTLTEQQASKVCGGRTELSQFKRQKKKPQNPDQQDKTRPNKKTIIGLP